jgi:TRAP transporter TAXI family solute receptor
MGKERIIIGLKAFLLGGLSCLIILLFTSSAFSQKKRISIGGAQAGGTHYPLAVGFAEIINRFLPEYNAIALETGGTLENIRLLGKGEIEIANADMQAAARGFKGEKPFANPVKNIRLGFYLNTVVLHVVTLEKSKIKRIEDLKGKVVSVGAPGSIVASTTEILLRLHNMVINDLKIRHLSPGEAMEALGDGLIDAAVLYSALPSSAVNSLAVKQKVRLVTGDEKVLKAAETKENILCFSVPPETYKGQSEGAFAWSVLGTTYINEATSAEDAYKWIKVILEHKDILQKVHPLGKQVRLITKNELEISPISLHPGILKYAKEVGVSY